ncbi:MAG: TIGR02265 family protein [Calditrichaeota bacterium]|nr:MAG: TIGR02265 family protein [Calditrichota bacterium]
MGDIKGLVIQTRLDFLENTDNVNLMNDVMQKLEDPARSAVGEQVFITNLYPFHLLKDLDTAIGESMQVSLESIFRDIGKRSASLILDRYFYNYVQVKHPHGFLAHFVRLYPFLWNFGTCSYAKSEEGDAIIHLNYDEDIHKPYCWFVQTLLKTGVEICGGKEVNLREIECEAEGGESCIYKLSWKE